jgi:hypothetical protein
LLLSAGSPDHRLVITWQENPAEEAEDETAFAEHDDEAVDEDKQDSDEDVGGGTTSGALRGKGKKSLTSGEDVNLPDDWVEAAKSRRKHDRPNITSQRTAKGRGSTAQGGRGGILLL